MAYPSHESSLLTRPKGSAARLNPAEGEQKNGGINGRTPQDDKTTHHAVKIHRHRINRQQQWSVYHSFKQTGHYTPWKNGGKVKTIHLSGSVVVECWLRMEVMRDN